MYALPVLCLPSRPGKDLIDIFSVAIWNKNKFAVAIATGLWVTNVVAITQGRSSALPSRLPSRCEIATGIARVNKHHGLPCMVYAHPYAAPRQVECSPARLHRIQLP